MTTDHLDRVTAFLDAREACGEARRGTISVVHGDDSRTGERPGMYRRPLEDADLRKLVDEVRQLRAEREPRKVTCPVCGRPTKLTATGLIRYHGPHNRPCKGSSILPEVPADTAPQQPERGSDADGAR